MDLMFVILSDQMKGSRKTIKQLSSKRVIEYLLGYGMVFLFSFLLLGKSLIPFFGEGLAENQSGFLNYSQSLVHKKTAHLPFENPIAPEKSGEEIDELEVSDNSNDSQSGPSFFLDAKLAFSKYLVKNTATSFVYRKGSFPSISLYILYQCWKGFLI